MCGKLWVKGSSDNGRWLGSFEYKKQRLMSSMLRAGDTVYGVGANVGYYTCSPPTKLERRDALSPSNRYRRMYASFSDTCDLNRLRNASLLEVAVSDHDGRPFCSPRERRDGQTLGFGKRGGVDAVARLACDRWAIPRPEPDQDRRRRRRVRRTARAQHSSSNAPGQRSFSPPTVARCTDSAVIGYCVRATSLAPSMDRLPRSKQRTKSSRHRFDPIR